MNRNGEITVPWGAPVLVILILDSAEETADGEEAEAARRMATKEREE